MIDQLAKVSRDPRGAYGVATLALVLAITRGGSADEATPASESVEVAAVVDAGASARDVVRLDIASDTDVPAGAAIKGTHEVKLGSRLTAIASCVGRYDEATRVCVLSPGPWELHSACFEQDLAPATTCEVVVRNTGAVPLKFSGYIEVAGP